MIIDMCGIVCAFKLKSNEEAKILRSEIIKLSKLLRHRGPDWSGIYANSHAILAHERLAIVDPASGKQPLVSADERYVLAVNGEIYNHQELRKELNFPFQTQSDCEVIIALYEKYGHDLFEHLEGMYAFALLDTQTGDYLIGRDHMGIIPLYFGYDERDRLFIASELKALEGHCKEIATFPPGHRLHSKIETPEKWYERKWMHYAHVADASSSVDKLREALEASVHKHMMSDVPYGVLLSGGLDSSIVSAVTKKYAAKRVETADQSDAWWPQLHSFAVGLEGSPDLKAAQQVADHIGTIHHEVIFTVQEGLDALRDVIYHLETYDVTTVRASTPMYLLARVIKSMGIKMVLSGEGADEIFGGYLYFHKAPHPEAFHEETVRKLGKLHLYDCLRANKALSAWGVEGRVPFLDIAFMDTAMQLNPADKMAGHGKIEKWILRKAFEDYLPESVAWRQKEQFSDGVGYSWIDSLKEKVEELVSDTDMEVAHRKFPVNTPQNKEEYYYRSLFEEHFPSDAAAKTVPSVPSVACSTPEALAWDESFSNLNDPSGRAVSTHSVSYES